LRGAVCFGIRVHIDLLADCNMHCHVSAVPNTRAQWIVRLQARMGCYDKKARMLSTAYLELGNRGASRS
jgi:hypothetical protein